MSGTGILLVGFTCLHFYVNAQCPDPATSYQCDPNNPGKVQVYGNTLYCPNGKVCNARNKVPCHMCIEYRKDCDGKFTCLYNPNLVQVGRTILKCSEYQACNKEYEDPCQPCVPKQCHMEALNNLRCTPNLDTAIVDNVEYPCATGFICNAKKVEPCYYCISAGETEIDISSTSTSPGIYTSTSTSTASSSATSTSGSSTSTAAESRTSSSDTSTSVTYSPTTESPGIFPTPSKPNCYDGSNRRCYPRNSETYYKCVCEWFWLKLEVSDCSWLKKDLNCKDVNGLCGK